MWYKYNSLKSSDENSRKNGDFWMTLSLEFVQWPTQWELASQTILKNQWILGNFTTNS